MSALTVLTLGHTGISLVGIFSGFVVAWGLLKAKRLDNWTSVFIWTTVATSVTGFLFPFHKLLPSHILGVLSLATLAVTIYARYGRNMAGGWRKGYAISAIIALYLNVFVLVAQLFMKVPALKALAPTQSEPPFLITQLMVLVLFIVLGIFGTVRFRIEQQIQPA